MSVFQQVCDVDRETTIEALEAVTLTLGVLLFGISIGLTLIGVRLPPCAVIAGQATGPHCGVAAWGSQTATATAGGGGLFCLGAMVLRRVSRAAS